MVSVCSELKLDGLVSLIHVLPLWIHVMSIDQLMCDRRGADQYALHELTLALWPAVAHMITDTGTDNLYF